MSQKKFSRRHFIKQNGLTSLGAVLGSGVTIEALSQSINNPQPAVHNGKILRLKPRYHRWHVDPGVDWLETNTHKAFREWEIPLSQSALVLVDVWQKHYLKDTEARTEKIINEKLQPLVLKCREEGLQVIHAPANRVAIKSPYWVKLTSGADQYFPNDNWPPADFRENKGLYEALAKPFEPREAERYAGSRTVDFHPKIRPEGNDAVVSSGEELHLYCKKRGFLFLIYAGFNTNGCILSRTYGSVNMSLRGYKIILVRDCTTGMESATSQQGLQQTNGAIELLEMWGNHTVTSDEIHNGFFTV